MEMVYDLRHVKQHKMRNPIATVQVSHFPHSEAFHEPTGSCKQFNPFGLVVLLQQNYQGYKLKYGRNSLHNDVGSRAIYNIKKMMLLLLTDFIT